MLETKDSTSGDFVPLECINPLEFTTGSTADNTPVMKKYQNEIKEAMDHVMKKAEEMMDRKIEIMIRDMEQQRTLHELNFKSKINELRRDILMMTVKHECFQKQTIDMMRQNHGKANANTSEISKNQDTVDKSTLLESFPQK